MIQTGSLNEAAKIDEQAEAGKLASLPMAYSVLLDRHDVSVGLFAPRDPDTQTPHNRDEIYIVSSGSGQFRRDREVVDFKTGDLLFVSAGVEHRFEDLSADCRVWVIFFGPRRAV